VTGVMPRCAVCGHVAAGERVVIFRDAGGDRAYRHKSCPQTVPAAERSDERTEVAEPARSDASELASRVLASLDEEQRAAVVAPIGPLRVLAGAGTGKTRALTHRIAYQHHVGVAPADRVLAVTHSKRAAREVRERLASLGVAGAYASTFHAAALRQLQMHWAHTGLPGAGPVVLDDRSRNAELRLVLTRVLRRRPQPEEVRDLAADLSWAAARRLGPEQFAQEAARSGRRSNVAGDVAATAYADYAARKRGHEMLDFDDLLKECAELLEKDDHIAALVRAQHGHLLVDEYQDTDPAQQRLLDAWLGGRDSICVVGDPNQSIYGFKGAEPGLIEAFADRFSQVTTVALVRDYRSTPQIVDAANAIAVPTVGTALVGQLAPGPEPVILAAEDHDEETQQIVATVQGLVATGVAPVEIAVLIRYHMQGVPIRTALLAAGLSVARLRDDESFFALRPVRDVLRVLQRQTHRHDAVATVREVLHEQGFDAATPPEDGLGLDRHETQAALLQLVTSLPEDQCKTVGDLVDELRRREAQEREPDSANSVSVGTIHAAKGLEWDAVLLPRLTDGSLPAAHAVTPDARSEERRLFYVGVTRARRHLRLSWARTYQGRATTRSPFLDLLDPPRPSRSRTEPKSKKRPELPVSPWAAGTRVHHDSFGLGRVLQTEPGFVVVNFGSGGVKKIKLPTRKMAAM
jgi:DNA helicase-2/ATP-dependent DNA helicase PcrA